MYIRGVLSYVFQWKTGCLHWVCMSRKRLLYVVKHLPQSAKWPLLLITLIRKVQIKVFSLI